MMTTSTLRAAAATLALALPMLPASVWADAPADIPGLTGPGYSTHAALTGTNTSYRWIPAVSGDGTHVLAEGSNGLASWVVSAGNIITLSGGENALGISLADINRDGSTVAGTVSHRHGSNAAFWRNGVLTVLPTLMADRTSDYYDRAYGISGDGHTVVGTSFFGVDANYEHAVRWVDGGAAQDLHSSAYESSHAIAASYDGSVIAGHGSSLNQRYGEAFIWTASGGMQGLGSLRPNGTYSSSAATDISADGKVIVGYSNVDPDRYQMQAFRWTQASGMVELPHGSDVIGSRASSVNGDGSVIVGTADVAVPESMDARMSARTVATKEVAFYWSATTGSQSLAQWLADNGVAVGATELTQALSVSDDGKTVVGYGRINTVWTGFVARVKAPTTGLLSQADFNASVGQTGPLFGALGTLAAMPLSGAHHRPLIDYPTVGKTCAWLTGDMRGSTGDWRQRQRLVEGGLCRDIGPLRLGIGGGAGSFSRRMELGGWANAKGRHGMIEADWRPVGTPLTLSLLGFISKWKLRTTRGYRNGGAVDFSLGRADVHSSAVRGRIDWSNAVKIGSIGFSPYAQLTHLTTKIGGFTEWGGAFPVISYPVHATGNESRIGLHARAKLAEPVSLAVTGEWAHRYEDGTMTVAGALVGGPFGYSYALPGAPRNWGRIGADLDIAPTAHTLVSLSAYQRIGRGREAPLVASISARIGF